MSFCVNKGLATGRKRLATVRKTPGDELPPRKVETGTDLYIVPYTEKSIVVMGETLNHSNALVALGGKYNTNLRIGQGWIFAKTREESVRRYIDTGEIVPYVYSKEDQAKFEKSYSSGGTSSGISEQELRKIFREFREAFDADQEYEGGSIIDVIYQLEELHLPGKAVTASPKKRLAPSQKRLARKPEPEPEPEDDGGEEEEGEMDSEDSEHTMNLDDE